MLKNIDNHQFKSIQDKPENNVVPGDQIKQHVAYWSIYNYF